MSNKPDPSFLTPGRPLTDAEWAAKAAGVRARLEHDQLLEQMFSEDPDFWNSPDE